MTFGSQTLFMRHHCIRFKAYEEARIEVAEAHDEARDVRFGSEDLLDSESSYSARKSRATTVATQTCTVDDVFCS